MIIMTFSRSIRALLFSTALMAPLIAHSEELNFDSQEFERLNIMAGPSSLGYTISASARLHKNWAVRSVLGYGEIDTKVVKEGIQVEGSFWGMTFVTDFPILSEETKTQGTIGGVGLFLDYYPMSSYFGEGFRVSTGVMRSLYQITGKGSDIGWNEPHSGNKVNIETVEMMMNVPSYMPYLGLGYTLQASENLSLNLDAGILFNAQFDGYMRGTARAPTTQAEIDYEFNKEMEDKLKELEPYDKLAYVGLMFSYSF